MLFVRLCGPCTSGIHPIVKYQILRVIFKTVLLRFTERSRGSHSSVGGMFMKFRRRRARGQ